MKLLPSRVVIFPFSPSIVEILFKCKICSYILTEPIQCTCCNELFCKECLIKYQKENNHCPNTTLTSLKHVHYVSAPTNITKALDSLVFYCKYYEYGCDEQIKLNELKTHEQKCEYSILNESEITSTPREPKNTSIRKYMSNEEQFMSFQKIRSIKKEDSHFLTTPPFNRNDSLYNKNILDKIEKIYEYVVNGSNGDNNNNNSSNSNSSNNCSEVEGTPNFNKVNHINNNNNNDKTQYNTLVKELTSLNAKLTTLIQQQKHNNTHSSSNSTNSSSNNTSKDNNNSKHNKNSRNTLNKFNTSITPFSYINSSHTISSMNTSSTNNNTHNNSIHHSTFNTSYNTYMTPKNDNHNNNSSVKAYSSIRSNSTRNSEENSVGAGSSCKKYSLNEKIYKTKEKLLKQCPKQIAISLNNKNGVSQNQIDNESLTQLINSIVDTKISSLKTFMEDTHSNNIKQYILDMSLDSTNLIIEKLSELSTSVLFLRNYDNKSKCN